MTGGTPEIFDQKANAHGILNRGFRPELYTVASGTYASNSVHGLGAPVINSYTNIQLARGVGPPFITSVEGCDIRQHGQSVDFTCSITLDGNPLTEPDFSNQELRIRPRRARFDQPGRYGISLPLAKRGTDGPVFKGVEIINKDGVQIAPGSKAGPGAWLLEAKLLIDGSIALLKRNIGILGTQVTALRHADIDDGFVMNQVIAITVYGSYMANAQINTGNLGSQQLFI